MENLFPIAQKLEGIEIDPYIYLHPTESSELLKCLKPCDVIFFSGAFIENELIAFRALLVPPIDEEHLGL
ncbi:hypothetical protein, partial [Klebsiella pneumoniae]|uniref:hypothetical protein n=1 Tax=Klebsiella pneumoniae TaxID=573 RepID=UPI001966D1E4